MIRFKIIILLFFSFLFSINSSVVKKNFEIINSDSNSTTILFTLDDYELIKNNNKYEFKNNDRIGLTMDEGHPQMPIYSTLFKIDPSKTYDISYDIISSKVIDNIDFKNYNNTSSESIYPLDNIYISDPQVMRDLVLNQIGFIPYKYSSQQKSLEVYEKVQINIIEMGNSNIDYFIPQKKSRVFAEIYQNSIINHEFSDRDEDYQIPSILYICGGNACNNSYFLDLVDWRHKQGYYVTVASTSDIGNSESSINNYISSAYLTGENPPEIVGLVGDVGGAYDIACDYYEWGSGWSTYSGASDVKYTYITGNDLLPEIVIGRISADSSSDLANIINKTIQYEKGTSQSEGWFERAAIIGDPTVGSGMSPAITGQWIKELMEQFGYEDVNADLNGGGNALENFLVGEFNEGITYYNYRGIYEAPGCYLDNGMINDLNNGLETPFATIITCGTGDYNYDDDSEEFIRIGSVTNPKGAVACVGMSTTGTHTAYNNIIDMGIYDGIFSKNLTHGGSAVANGRISMYETYPSNPSDIVGAFSAWCNLMGDPALHLWTDTPKDFLINDIPLEIPLGTNHIDLIVTDSEENIVEDARVTILLGTDIIFESTLTDSQGLASLSWDNQSTGQMYLTITKKNYRPLERSIQITDEFAVESYLIENGEWLPGDTKELTIDIRSIGSQNIVGLSGTLKSDNEDLISVLSNYSLYPDLNNQNYQSNNNPYIIQISGNASYEDEVNLILELSDGNGNNWDFYIPCQITSSNIYIEDFGIEGREIEPGTTVEAYVQLKNNGNLSSGNIDIEFFSDSYLVNISNENISVDNIDEDQVITIESPVFLTFSTTIIEGSVFPIGIKVTDSNNYSNISFSNITVGELTDLDPLGPDTYGYYIYDYQDIEYELAPVYDWIEIDPQYNEVVSGQNLNLTDYGEGNYPGGDNPDYSSALVDLPFSFGFYGELYSQITINTNGWIVFGYTDAHSFRNHPIPGAGGPSPMVAAFWDDMTTNSGGKVLTAIYDEDNDGLDDFIIQWSNMRTDDNNSDEDFQIILYQSNNLNIDGDIKIQYKEFNNTSNGYYPNGQGTPKHGAYTTVGIENKEANKGLQYTFNNVYPKGASDLGDETTIFITTKSPSVDWFYGDTNADEVLNVLDVVLLVNMVLQTQYIDMIGDMNQDQIINILDVVLLVTIVLEG